MSSLLLTGVGGSAVITPEYFGAARYIDWNFQDSTTLFQDTGGTVPVAAGNDPIALCVDSSGNARNLTQPSDPARPLWKDNAFIGGKPCALPDKSDDFLVYTAAVPSGYTIFISCHTIRTSFPGPATFDPIFSSGIGGSNNYDRDTYNGFVTTANNRVGQRRSTDFYVNGATFTNGSSVGTTAVPIVMSAVTDGTAGSNVAFSVFRNTDGAFYGNQPTHRIIVISRLCTAYETIGLHNYLLATG